MCNGRYKQCVCKFLGRKPYHNIFRFICMNMLKKHPHDQKLIRENLISINKVIMEKINILANYLTKQWNMMNNHANRFGIK